MNEGNATNLCDLYHIKNWEKEKGNWRSFNKQNKRALLLTWGWEPIVIKYMAIKFDNNVMRENDVHGYFAVKDCLRYVRPSLIRTKLES